jgi:O-antigen/teichoic acid export membrane protein
MPTLLRRWLPEISFLRKLSILAGGTLLGQALVVLSSPLLTRFFTSEEFGVFAVFGALAGILGAVIALRFELAVLVATDDEDAAALVMVTIVAAAAMALLQVFLIWRLGGWFVAMVDTPVLAGWLWLLPPATFACRTYHRQTAPRRCSKSSDVARSNIVGHLSGMRRNR